MCGYLVDMKKLSSIVRFGFWFGRILRKRLLKYPFL